MDGDLRDEEHNEDREPGMDDLKSVRASDDDDDAGDDDIVVPLSRVNDDGSEMDEEDLDDEDDDEVDNDDSYDDVNND